MRVILRTAVPQSPAQVMAGFTRELFLALAPPFPKLKLRRFDGCHTGDKVEIELDTLVKKLPWTSLIVDDGVLPDGTHFFVDEGQILPPPLRYWQHRHLLEPGPNGGCIIVDNLEYRTASRLLDALIYPAMWAQFAWRQPIYRRWFKRP
jgi:ligand-binding SRPBCC domain-containing protein